MAAVAIGTTVVAVGGAAVSAGMQSSAAGKAAKAQGAAAKKAQRQEKEALKAFQEGQARIEGDLGQIQAPVRDPKANIREAERITGYNISQLDRMYGGQYKNLQDLAVRAINDRLSGQMTQSAREATMRESAYMQGAGFNPATARAGAIAQRGPFDYLRAIGQSAEQAVTQGFNMMGDWSRTAAGFIANPLAVSQDSLAYQMGAANVGLSKVGIKANLLSSMYGAQTGQAQRGYARQQENIGASLARDQATAQGIQDVSGAIGQAGMSGYGAYSQYATAKASGIPQYSSLASAQQAAPYAGGYSQIQGMGYVPRATAV
jgi:hypothetical protein